MDESRSDPRLERLNSLLAVVCESNQFQRERLGRAQLDNIDELSRLPRTSKDDLLADQAAHPPFGSNLTFDVGRYTHLHHTSGTTGATLRILDTPEDWAWWRRRLGSPSRAVGASGSMSKPISSPFTAAWRAVIWP